MSRLLGSLLVLGLSGCSVIDEDLSDCAPEPEVEYDIDYELRLVTNMTTELRTQLNTQTSFHLIQTLRSHLSEIFSDYAHDVDLSFYDTKGDSIRLQHDEHIMDANQASYELNLPKRQYMHLAAANVVDNKLVNIANADYCHPASLKQLDRDTIDSHTTGIFTAREPMEVLEGVDQDFNVQLYMANCAAALVIDPREHSTDSIMVYSTGFATGFSICDSAYQYVDNPPIIRTRLLNRKEGETDVAYCSVSFPSRDPEGQSLEDLESESRTRTIIETTDPFIAKPEDKALWEFRVYVPQGDGTYTQSILGIRVPLRAGQLKIIKCWLGDNGAVSTDDEQTVGVSVTLNWRPGGTHVVPL